MPTYHFHLENSVSPSGDFTGCEYPTDADAVKEAGNAAGQVLTSELSEGHANPRATVTIERDGIQIAVIKAQATIQHFI